MYLCCCPENTLIKPTNQIRGLKLTLVLKILVDFGSIQPRSHYSTISFC